MIGRKLSHYGIVEKIGSGGMGQVYKARDEHLDRDVAIKVLREDLVSDPERLRRFEQEARSASALNHPNIITIYDIAEHEGTPFIAMEYVEGQTLREILAGGSLTAKKLLELASQIVEGLAKAHAAGIIHRDLKPENLMVTSDGYVKILDFGLAKLLPEHELDSEAATITKEGTAAGSVMGTASYMSPEQALGKPLDARTDIFSLGVVLYEMATGNRTFQGETNAGLFNEILNNTPRVPSSVNPEIPKDLDRIIGRALEKDVADRYTSVKDLLLDLKTVRTNTPTVAATTQKSIVVLPFENMSPDPEQEYFCDGMTEEIIADLSKIQSVRVISRTTSMRLRGTDKDIETIGKDLKVQYVLEGSVRKAGNNIRITAQLIDSTSDAHLWAEKYSGTLEDVFEIQEQVAHAIANELKLKLTPEVQSRIGKRETENTEAYRLYLRGRHQIWRGAHTYSLDRMLKGMELLRQAIAIDPNFAEAYSQIGMAYSWWCHGYVPDAPENASQLRQEYAQRALDLDETLALPHELIGVTHLVDWEWKSAKKEFLRALALDPSSANGHTLCAFYHLIMGRREEALVEIQRAQNLDPLEPFWSFWVGQFLGFQGRHQEATRHLELALEMAPDHVEVTGELARNCARLGRKDKALSFIHKYHSLKGDGAEAAESAAQAYDTGRWAGYLEWNLKQPGQSALDRAVWYAELDRRDEALSALEEACHAHDPNIQHTLLGYEVLDPLHDDPRFKALLQHMNLPE